MGVSNFAVIVIAARQSHVKTCSERLPFNFDQSPKKYPQRQTKHSAAGILVWSLAVLMICRSVELIMYGRADV
jgi:hypothetical protein